MATGQKVHQRKSKDDYQRSKAIYIFSEYVRKTHFLPFNLNFQMDIIFVYK